MAISPKGENANVDALYDAYTHLNRIPFRGVISHPASQMTLRHKERREILFNKEKKKGQRGKRFIWEELVSLIMK